MECPSFPELKQVGQSVGLETIMCLVVTDRNHSTNDKLLAYAALRNNPSLTYGDDPRSKISAICSGDTISGAMKAFKCGPTDIRAILFSPYAPHAPPDQMAAEQLIKERWPYVLPIPQMDAGYYLWLVSLKPIGPPTLHDK